MTTTHVLFVTDKSGSMYGVASDVRGGFNSMIEDWKKDTDNTYSISVRLFDTEQYQLCAEANLDQVPVFDEHTYRTGGSTALLDAVGDTIAQFKEKHQDLGSDKVILVVQTDGEENSSRRYGFEDIKKRLDKIQEEGWAVLFLGQGLAAWDAGQRLYANSSRVGTSGRSTRSSYAAVGQTVSHYASGHVTAQGVVDWFKEEYDKRDKS